MYVELLEKYGCNAVLENIRQINVHGCKKTSFFM